MDQLEAMRAFQALADAGSLSAAARGLGVTVPSVSRRLQALESHLGAKLVKRSTRKLALTAAGTRYLETCRRILAQIEEADRGVARADAGMSGSLVVTAPVAFGRRHVLPVVVEFLRAHSGVDARLTLSDQVVEMIDAGVDLAVRIAPLPDSTLVAKRVGSVRSVVCASPDYLDRHGEPERPEDLASHDCITVSGFGSPERWSFPVRGVRRAVAVRTRLAVSTAEGAVDAAAAGAGVARVLSYQAADAVAEGRLRPILERFEPPPIPVSVVHGEGRDPRPRVRAFVQLATARLRASLHDES